MFYYIRCHQIVIFNQKGVPPNCFKDLRGAANQKRLKNTGIENMVGHHCSTSIFYQRTCKKIINIITLNSYNKKNTENTYNMTFIFFSLKHILKWILKICEPLIFTLFTIIFIFWYCFCKIINSVQIYLCWSSPLNLFENSNLYQDFRLKKRVESIL